MIGGYMAIDVAFRRLDDSLQYLVKAREQYFSPEEFRRSLNSCIQEVRNITFVLQSNKNSIESFESWYTPHQDRMKNDEKMKWIVSSRNKIVKQGDLELNSKLKITVVQSYFDDENPIYELNLCPFIDEMKIVDSLIENNIPIEKIKNNYLKIERCWVECEFSDTEVLSLILHSIIELSKIIPNNDLTIDVDEIHKYWSKSFEEISVWTKLHDGRLEIFDLEERIVEIDKKQAKERYGEEVMKIQSIDSDGTFGSICNKYFEMAKILLLKDGYHQTMAFLFKNGVQISMMGLSPEDQADKYRMTRKLANDIEISGADAVIHIGEVWVAKNKNGVENKHALEYDDKTEALMFIAISKDDNYTLKVPFKKVSNTIKLSKEIKGDLEGVNLMVPIIRAIKKSLSGK